MFELAGIAEMVAGRLAEGEFGEKGMSVSDIASIFGSGHGEGINLYPSDTKGSCHRIAVVVSLSSKAHKGNRRGHLSCEEAVQKLVQHMVGHCPGRTQEAVLVVDDWDADVMSDWSSTLRSIGRSAKLEVYLIAGRGVTKIDV